MTRPRRTPQASLRPDFNTLVAYTGIADGLSPASRYRVRSAETSQGNWQSVFRGQGMEFESVRAYVPGDEVRHIDWRVTARTGKPHLKLFREERQRQLFIAVDDGPSMHFGTRGTFKNVQAALIAALMGGSALKRKERVGGMVFRPSRVQMHDPDMEAVVFGCTARRQGLLCLLKQLAAHSDEFREATSWTAIKGQGLPGLWTSLVRDRALRLSGGGEVAIISDFSMLPPEPTDELKRALGMLGQMHEVLLIAVDDPADRALPHAGKVWVMGEDGTPHEIDTESATLRQGWSLLWEKRRETLQQLCKRYAIPLIHVNTNEAPAVALKRQLGQLQRKAA